MTGKKYKGYLIDLDGTIYLGTKRIPAAEDFIHRLQKAGIPYLFLTNNTTKRPETVQARLANEFNIETSLDSIYTASAATADYLDDLSAEKNLAKTVYIIGEDGLKSEIYSRGYQENPKNPAFVVVGMDSGLTYEKATVATLAIHQGAIFIGTNADLNLPSERGLLPGAGSVIRLIEAATGVQAIYIGKPEAIISEKAVKKLALEKKDILMVGDNYLTDICTGLDNGFDTLLVTTGFTKPEEVAGLPKAPTYVVSSLADWSLEWMNDA